MRITDLFRVVIMLLAAVALLSCATSAIKRVWKDESVPPGQVKKVFVIGVSANEGMRRAFEDEFVKELKARGTDAVAGYTALPENVKLEKDVLVARIRETGSDAAIITKLVSTKTERMYVPSQPAGYPYGPAHGPVYGNFYGYYGTVMTPGYVVEDEIAVLETKLYNVSTEKLIWAAESEAWGDKMNTGAIREFIGIMVAQLQRDRLIK